MNEQIFKRPAIPAHFSNSLIERVYCTELAATAAAADGMQLMCACVCECCIRICALVCMVNLLFRHENFVILLNVGRARNVMYLFT